MKIVIINLKNSRARKDFQLRQAQELSISVDFFEAISRDQLSEEKYHELYETWERPMSKAEICCFLSHKSVWKRVIEEDEPILILEDDAILSCHIKKILLNLKDIKNVDRINLEARVKKKSVATKSQSVWNYKIMKLYVDRSGAAGYIIYPSGAKKLLEKFQQKAALADKIDRDSNLRSFQLEPSAVLALDFCHHFEVNCLEASETTITSNADQLSYSEYRSMIFSRFRRALNQLKLIAPQFSCLISGQKRFIKVHSSDFNPSSYSSSNSK